MRTVTAAAAFVVVCGVLVVTEAVPLVVFTAVAVDVVAVGLAVGCVEDGVVQAVARTVVRAQPKAIRARCMVIVSPFGQIRPGQLPPMPP
ncbi:hypothetical protein [Streptomyces collinus]|uniref:hypothetical protein n=1 Tax=Streptomyces collinus TaxID=42684 RepID=UPI003677ADEB